MDQEVDKIIRNAKEQLGKSSENGDKGKKGGKSLLTLLLEATKRDSKLSLNNAELNDGVKTFIFAGHETTATWCKMAIYALIQHPEFQEKVYQDIAKHASPSKQLDLEVIDKMEYFNAFMQEVLRMCPPGISMRESLPVV
jgi:cytochrome P450